MNIQPVSQNNFKGYDARPLKGFLMSSNSYGIADEMKRIGDIEGFKIFGFRKNGLFKWECGEYLSPKSSDNFWAQDLWSIVKGKLLTHNVDNFSDKIKACFGLQDNLTQKIIRTIEMEKVFANLQPPKKLFNIILSKTAMAEENAHIAGGNLFIIKGDSKDEVIVGGNDLGTIDTTDVMSMYYVDKVTVLPSMDYHLDLFIRPLDKKRILITDDNLSLKVLEKIYRRLNQNPDKYSEAIDKTANMIKEFKATISKNPLPQADEVEEILKTSGYTTIRVPGRIYNIDSFTNSEGGCTPQHYCNFINANVLKNKRGKLVYITNKSNIDSKLGLTPEIIEETGCSFEKAFVNSISSYVGSHHIYLVDGENDFISKEMLTNYQGGIHCVCMEVPDDKNSKN